MQKCIQDGAAEIVRQTQYLDARATNLANMNTYGYKAQDVAFCDLVYKNNDDIILAESVAKKARTSRDHAQGVIAKSENPLSVALQGPGFFKVINEHGDEYFTRDGDFKQDAAGQLVNSAGFALEGVDIPADTEKIYINEDGLVECSTFEGDTVDAGQVNVYSFNLPQELKAVGDNLFTALDADTEVVVLDPGAEDGTRLRQGYIEVSNTNWTLEMKNLIQTQRTIQINSQHVVKTADQIWEMANNLRR